MCLYIDEVIVLPIILCFDRRVLWLRRVPPSIECGCQVAIATTITVQCIPEYHFAPSARDCSIACAWRQAS